MTAHVWKPHPDRFTAKRPFQNVRVCALCGAEQVREAQYEWMRVTGYRWEPNVGKCKGKMSR